MQISQLLNNYEVNSGVWDEMSSGEVVRPQYMNLMKSMHAITVDELIKKEEQAKD